MWKGGGGWEGVSLVGGGLCLIQMLTIRRFHPAIQVSISSIPQFRSDSRSSFEVSMELLGGLILQRRKRLSLSRIFDSSVSLLKTIVRVTRTNTSKLTSKKKGHSFPDLLNTMNKQNENRQND